MLWMYADWHVQCRTPATGMGSHYTCSKLKLSRGGDTNIHCTSSRDRGQDVGQRSRRLFRCRSTVKVKKYPRSTVNLYRQLEFHRTHTLWATSTVSGLLYYREFMPYCNFLVLTRWDWLAKFSSVESGRDNR